MNCMKCGRDVKEGQAFCESCLEEMEREPVKISTPVHIPSQPPKNAAAHYRPNMHPEEEVQRLEKTNQNLILALAIAVIAAILFGFAAFYNEIGEVVDDLGRNYSVVETKASIGR